ncbi:BlaI/MecI/CopY family transcriptional regulator [Fusibacter bizertensis]
MGKKAGSLSEKEKEIMMVLWQVGEPLTASSIAENGEALNINTVQALTRNLLKKNFIEVADIVYSGTVLSRRYRPLLSAEEYASENLEIVRKNSQNFSTLNFIDHLINEDDTVLLDALERLIQDRKKSGGH